MIDTLGDWQSLGNVTVNDTYQVFSTLLSNGNVIRLTYQLDWMEWESSNYRSYGLMRFRYPVQGYADCVTPSFKIYPKQERELRAIEPLKGISDSTEISSFLEIKRVTYARRVPINATIVPWTLSAEYL